MSDKNCLLFLETIALRIAGPEDIPAQRLYIRRGYIPDGAGAVYDRLPERP